MKKLLALLLAVLMVMSLLSACGDKKDEKKDESEKTDTVQSEKEETQSSEQSPTLTPNVNQNTATSNAPEYDADEVELYYSFKNSNGDFSGHIKMINNASPAKIYYTMDAIGEEYYYELDDNNIITKYVGDEKDTASSQETLKEETDYILDILSLSGWNFNSRNPGLEFKPTEDPNLLDSIGITSSKSVWYEIYKNGGLVGYAAVDGESGVIEFIKTSDMLFGAIIVIINGEYA